MTDSCLVQRYLNSLSEFEQARLKAHYLRQMADHGHLRRAFESGGWEHPRVQKDFRVFVVCQIPPHFQAPGTSTAPPC